MKRVFQSLTAAAFLFIGTAAFAQTAGSAASQPAAAQTETVNVTVQNDTQEPFAWKAGEATGTIAPGQSSALKVAAGTKLYTAEGKELVTVGKEHDGKTVTVSSLK